MKLVINIFFCIICIFCSVSEAVYAEEQKKYDTAVINPKSLAKNSRIGVFSYVEDAIYRYEGYYTYESNILFAIDEEIKSIFMGDSTGWQMEPSGNRLFLKPIGRTARTNMTLITNKRVYFFEMRAKKVKKYTEAKYEVRFHYPEEEAIEMAAMISPEDESEIPHDLDDPNLNFNYSYKGAGIIAPVKVFDNGNFTFLEFPANNTELPAIFHVNSDGYEGLVNYRVRGSYMILERVGSLFTLRSGNDIVCLFNEVRPFEKQKLKK